MKKLLFLVLFFMSIAWSKESVTLQLSWLHQFQFAGYYIAKEKGFYSDSGLDVTILDAHNKQDPFGAVMKGKAQYGVGRSSLIVDYVNGAPVVLMAAVFQSSMRMRGMLTVQQIKVGEARSLMPFGRFDHPFV